MVLDEDGLDEASTGDSQVLPLERLTRIYRTMLVARRFDEHCNDLIAKGHSVPHFHSGIGQEALAVASVDNLRKRDHAIYTHRGIGHLLGKGVSVGEIALDMFHAEGGTNRGLGSVLHVSRPDIGIVGREGFLGTRFGIAVGLALADKLRRNQGVVVCFYGEAAGARGPLYEALNMAVLWSLPVIFVAENNGWSFSSRTEWLFPDGRMTKVWRGFEIPVNEVDGNDAEAVSGAMDRAVSRARRGGGPSVIEGMTYRTDPHIYWDREPYRSASEVAAWRDRDPVRRLRKVITARGGADADLARIEEQALAEVSHAFDAARSAPSATWDAPAPEVFA